MADVTVSISEEQEKLITPLLHVTHSEEKTTNSDGDEVTTTTSSAETVAEWLQRHVDDTAQQQTDMLRRQDIASLTDAQLDKAIADAKK